MTADTNQDVDPTFSRSMPDIDWTELSDRAQVILTKIAVPIYLEGRSRQEIASDLGRSRDWINKRLIELQGEVEALAEPMPEAKPSTRTVTVYADEETWRRWMGAAYHEEMRLSDWAAAVVDREARRVLMRVARERV